MTKSKGDGRGGARPNTGKVKTVFRYQADLENLPLLNSWEELGFTSRNDLINLSLKIYSAISARRIID
jgi:hypothetical protein